VKRCPQCSRVEADDALTFCRADGTPLVRESGAAGESAGTLKFTPARGEDATETRALPTAEPVSGSTPRTRVLGGSRVTGGTRESGRPKSRRGILMAAAAIIVLAVAASAYFYSSRQDSSAVESIAVLPFANAGGDPDTEYLSDGITESIINSLSQLPRLGVIARNSAFRYKGRGADAPTVGRELGVRSVLTGRVAQRGDTLSISVELVDATNNHQLWGQQYNRKLADVFAVQEEIAREITERLRVRLSGAERRQLAKRPTENLKAFQYYTQGQTYAQRRTREDLLTALRHFERAVEEDRDFALAYAGLADAYDNLGARGYIAPAEGRRRAEEAARKALALDGDLAEAHAMLGQTYTDFAPYDFALADRELHRAIELSPSLAMARLHLGASLLRQGRLDEGLKELQKAQELDPLSPIIARQQALGHYLKRDFAQAVGLLRQANESGPAFSVNWEIGPYIQIRSFSEALAELEKAKQERKGDPVLIHFIGMVYAAQGKKVEALQIVKELELMSGESLALAFYIAKICATLNEKEMALSWLSRGLDARAITVFYRDEPVWDPLRSDPRFAELLRRMGVPR